MSFNHVDLYREGFHAYDIICDFIYDFIIIIFLITSQVVIIAWFYKNEQSMSEMSKQIELLKSSSNMRMSEMSKQIETLKSTINTNKIISDKNEQSLSEMSKQIESVKTFSCFILFNDTENTGNYITLLDEKNIMNLLQFYSSLKYHDIPRIFNVFIKIWLRHATEDQLIMIIPKFIKYNYAYEFDGVYEGRTNFYFNDPNFLRYFKDATRGYNNSEELHNRITNAFVYIDNSLK